MNSRLIRIIRLILGSLFILSALSKLFPIESFDLTLVNQGITNWNIAPYLSRFIISVELFLGISFFVTPFVKKIAIPFSFLLLIVFCIHLVFLISAGNGTKNCGCFGELIPMSSLHALIKNIVLILLLFLLQKIFIYEKNLVYSLPFAVYIIVFAAIFLIFQVNPYIVPALDNSNLKITDSLQAASSSKKTSEIDTVQTTPKTPVNNTKNEVKKPTTNPQQTASVFASFKEFSDHQKVNLDEGTKIICLFSLDCEDCMETARKLGKGKKELDDFPPLYILFLGEENQVNAFFKYAETTFTYEIISPQTFFPLIKNYPPRVVLLKNGNIIGDWDFENFSLKDLGGKL